MDPATREKLADLLLTWEDAFRVGHDLPAADLAGDRTDLIEPLARRIRILKGTYWIDHAQEPADDQPDPPPPGGRLLAGRYRLDERIALGSFAEVWRAFDIELQRTVAVKIPKASRIAMKDTFMAEARRVARLRHPGIVPVHDVGTDGDSCFIVAEFMDGGSLADRLARQLVDPTEAIRWTAQIADALDYAHRNGVVHRDVKPANILLNHHGDAILTDFGIAQSATKTGEFAPSVGTLRYMAPEQLAGGPIGPTADIYSLGIVLHEMLVGVTPHSGEAATTIRRDAIGSRDLQISRSLPPGIAPICRQAVLHDPASRQPTAAAMAMALRAAATPTSRSHVGVIIGAMAAALLAAALITSPGGSPAKRIAVPMTSPPPITAAPRPAKAAPVEGTRASLTFLRIAESLPYVVATANVAHFSEWQSSPDTYLGPRLDDVEGFVTYRFDFPAPVTRVRLIAVSRCWDFTKDPGGQGRGAVALEASPDGSLWTRIRDGIAGPDWGDDWAIDEPLPATATGGTSLWLRVRLLTNGSPNSAYSVAQFGRNRDDPSQPTFGIIAELERPAESITGDTQP